MHESVDQPKPAIDPTRSAKRRRVRWLFALVAIVLPAELAVERTIGEPYPAVLMPGFPARAPVEGGWVVFTNFDVEIRCADGGESVHVPFYEFMRPIGQGHAKQLLFYSFRPFEPRVIDPDPPLMDWVKRVFFPNRLTRRRIVDEQRLDAELVGWVEEKARRASPGRQPIAVLIHWSDDHARRVDGRVERRSVPVGDYEIDLTRRGASDD